MFRKFIRKRYKVKLKCNFFLFMKPIQEYSIISNKPQLFFCNDYDPKLKYECSCSIIVTALGLVFIDPLPLTGEALAALLSEASMLPAGILITSSKHQRSSLELAEQLKVPIYAPVGSESEISASHFYKPGDEVLGLQSLSLPGFGLGETAFWSEEGKILILGDALINDEEGNLIVLPKKYCTDHRIAMRSLSRLNNFVPRILVTAHGLPIINNAASRLREVCTLN